MVDYEQDNALQEIHDEMYRKEEERPTSSVTNIQKVPRMWIGIAVAILAYLLMIEKITFTQAALAVLAGIVILYFMGDDQSKRGELTYIECMIRLNDLLKFLQKHPIGDVPQIPKGEVAITPIGRKQWFEGQGFKRSFGVKVYDDDLDITENYFTEVDIRTGDIITFRHAPEGVVGDETKDIKLMPTYDMLVQKKRDKYLNKAFK